MLRIRTFRNGDPPALAAIWSAAGLGPSRSALPAAVFERSIFSKPYFDPAGLIVAEINGKPVGFVHAGFGPNDNETAIDRQRGVICALLVHPDHRRAGIGRQLLERAEEYLGCPVIQAGAARPLNPFYFGLYGGSDLPGVLASDPGAGPFFVRHGYRSASSSALMEHRFSGDFGAPDPRSADIRRKYEIRFLPGASISSWWQDCVIGWIEPVEFRLEDKRTGQPAARVVVWELDNFEGQWNQSAVGILDLLVRADIRRQGLGRYLVDQLMRAVQEQRFGLARVQVPEENVAAIRLFRSLEFRQVDTGHTYCKDLAKVGPTTA